MHIPKRKVVIILQARMGSSRLPGKVLKTVMGRPLLSYQLERLQAVSCDEIVVATSHLIQDDPIAIFCHSENIKCFRGSEHDVLDRYYQTAIKFNADVIVRVTGDCPLIDADIVNKVIQFFLNSSPPLDYVSNSLIPTFPRGLDVEVFSIINLKRAYHLALRLEEREHVTPYFYLHPELFKLDNVACEKDLSQHRWTVDVSEDLDLVTKILEALYPKNKCFKLNDILEILQQHPHWIHINAHIKQKRLNVLDKMNS